MDRRTVQFAGGKLGRERHICAFFNSSDEEYRTLLPFIKEGIECGEKACHIVDPALQQDHLDRLSKAGIDTEAARDKGQLDVLRWEQAYLRGDVFDQDAMLALIEDVLQNGAKQGFPLTRLVAHMEWALLDRQGVNDLVEYETRLNYILPKYDDPVICTYDLAKFGARSAMDILRTHPSVIIGGMLVDNPFFVPPDKFLLELRERKSDTRGHAARSSN